MKNSQTPQVRVFTDFQSFELISLDDISVVKEVVYDKNFTSPLGATTSADQQQMGIHWRRLSLYCAYHLFVEFFRRFGSQKIPIRPENFEE